jgi:DNA gyrase/topoisomerase IV subunit A
MNLNEGDVISRVHQVPDLDDQLFLLSGKGVVIRISAVQTKETSGRSSKGTRVMELRAKSKNSFIDELIFSARMPAELAEEILTEKSTDEEGDDKPPVDGEEE